MYKLESLGCDPEFFLSRDGVPVSSIGKIGGDKESTRKLKNTEVLEDNVSVEINPPPAFSKEEFVKNVSLAMLDIRELIQPMKLDLLKVTGVEFPKLELSDPMALISGCEPDFNAYTEEENPAVDLELSNFRAAAGHVHIGFDYGDMEEVIDVVKVLDYTLGVPLAKLFSKYPDEKGRRELYGKAGAFRFKEYGVEYRVPSNRWCFRKILMGYIWDRVEYALNNFDTLRKEAEANKNNTLKIINGD